MRVCWGGGAPFGLHAIFVAFTPGFLLGGSSLTLGESNLTFLSTVSDNYDTTPKPLSSLKHRIYDSETAGGIIKNCVRYIYIVGADSLA